MPVSYINLQVCAILENCKRTVLVHFHVSLTFTMYNGKYKWRTLHPFIIIFSYLTIVFVPHFRISNISRSNYPVSTTSSIAIITSNLYQALSSSQVSWPMHLSLLIANLYSAFNNTNSELYLAFYHYQQRSVFCIN